jgi:hypothetical protein
MMPLLLAMTEAMSAKWFFSGVRSTTSFSYATLVNGPFAAEIGMNSAANALGSGTGNRTNASIGRFNRLSLICLGGSQTGISDMSSIGNPSKFSFAFSENEERSPWEPFHCTQTLSRNDSAVTIFGGGWSFLSPFARMMADVDLGIESIANGISRFELPGGALLLMDPLVARKIADAGYSKSDAEAKIRELATRTAREFRNDYFYKPFIEPSLRGKSVYSEVTGWDPALLTTPDDEAIQVFPAGSVRIVVVGGETNPMTQAWQMARPSTISIDKWR